MPIHIPLAKSRDTAKSRGNEAQKHTAQQEGAVNDMVTCKDMQCPTGKEGVNSSR